MKIVLATGNANKRREIQEVLGNDFKVFTMKDEGINVDIIEDGRSFEENALIKVRALRKYTNEIIMADDSGLEVDALGKKPGVYSARYAGEGASDKNNNEKLLKDLKDVPEEKRGARFVCVIALSFPDGRELTFRGECEGKITFNYQGNNGFGYDPLFAVKGIGKTFGELTSEEKNQISHRAKALRKVVQFFREIKNKGENYENPSF